MDNLLYAVNMLVNYESPTMKLLHTPQGPKTLPKHWAWRSILKGNKSAKTTQCCGNNQIYGRAINNHCTSFKHFWEGLEKENLTRKYLENWFFFF